MKSIPSAHGLLADQLGQIWHNGTIVKTRPHPSGYRMLSLPRAIGRGERYVHRLVCEAFHGPCPDGQHCRHLDGTRTNNVPSNLAWGTKAENEADKLRHGTLPRGERLWMAVLTDAIVLDARRRVANGEKPHIIAADYNVKPHCLADAVMGRTWKHLPGALPKFSSRRKLSAQDIAEVRRLRSQGSKLREIAARFGVTQGAISMVLSRKTMLSALPPQGMARV